MKKLLAILMIAIFTTVTVNAEAIDTITMYAPDGRELAVSAENVDAHKAVGWYDSKDAVTQTMYAPDGRELVVWLADVPAYKAVGWYENKADVTKTMYTPDGRDLTVWLADVPAYKAVGWYENKAEVTKTMYAPDGRELTVWLADVPAYKAVGWYENKTEVTKTMYAPDGRELAVWLTEVDAYKAVGWYDNKDDVTTVLGSADGRKITVFNSQVDEYLKVGWFMLQQNTIDPTKPMVALTFDDGPAQTYTDIILDTLELYNARATFFVVGNRISGNEDILQRMNALKCQIGNHTYSHPNLASLSSYKISSQISNTDNAIYNAVGTYSTAVRPPYGSVNSTVKSTINKPMILWSLDTLDWKYRDSSYVTKAVTSNVKDGDIILMHDIHKTSAYAAKTIIPTLIKMGYQLVTVDELAQYKGYTMQGNTTYSQFK